jgi:adenosylhomocysteinase
VRPQVLEHVLADGRRLHLLAHGRVVNLAAAEGHPAAVMDLAFAGQALAAEYLVAHAGELEPRVLAVPAELEREIARLKLSSLGIEIDTLTSAQEDYLTSWEQGT